MDISESTVVRTWRPILSRKCRRCGLEYTPTALGQKYCGRQKQKGTCSYFAGIESQKSACKKNWQKYREIQLAWYAAHPNYEKEYWLRRRLKMYGLQPEELEELKVCFGNRCGICEKQVKLNIDHDHNTGKVRGLLCLQCNAKLGVLENEPWLTKAQAYLLKFSQ